MERAMEWGECSCVIFRINNDLQLINTYINLVKILLTLTVIVYSTGISINSTNCFQSSKQTVKKLLDNSICDSYTENLIYKVVQQIETTYIYLVMVDKISE